MSEASVLASIEAAQAEKESSGEYVVRGAVVKCSYGSNPCIVNLPTDHGQYIQGKPLISAKDSRNKNIKNFGTCSKTEKKCNPDLSEWMNACETTGVWDLNTLNYQMTVNDALSYCTCLTNQGIVNFLGSGQTFSTIDRAGIYITDDMKGIVVNGIYFEIYNPQVDIDNIRSDFSVNNDCKWYTIFEHCMTEMDFDIVRGLTGTSFEMEDFGREEVSNYANATVVYNNGKTKYESTKIGFVNRIPEADSYAAKATLVSAAVYIVMEILEALANSIEYTYVTFYFQTSSEGEYRVVLLGGTKSDYYKYYNYTYYGIDRSYIYDIVPDMFDLLTKNGLKQELEVYIREVMLPNIYSGKTNTKLLASEDELWLKKGEYYDIVINLSRKRILKKHQLYLYSENGILCQRLISYPGESFAIIKRSGLFSGNNYIRLIEMIDDVWTIRGNVKFWKIFEKYLRNEEDNISSKSDSGLKEQSIINLF